MPSRDERQAGTGVPGAAKDTLIDLIEGFGSGDLRDIWVLDERTEEPLYVREDVSENIADVDVERYMDNERYGFVTRETYNQLHYSEFAYTLRGFDTWELFRTFLADDATKVGVLCSFDRRPGGFDYSLLNDEIQSLTDEFDVAAFAPSDD